MTRNPMLELEIEVPGAPEQVWEAIATGPGITAWFAATEMDEREGGTIRFDLGAGIESTGVVTAWQPPHRFEYEEPLDERSKLATEWLVEARSGGTCVVRLVSSLFGTGADWEDELGGMSEGWQAYLHNLRIYLTDFPGARCAPLTVSGDATGSLDDGWEELTTALGIEGAEVGDEIATSGGPRLAGTVERRAAGHHQRELLLRLSEPAPGTAFLLVFRYQERLHAEVRAYLFGADAAAVAARESARWQAWMDEQFAGATR
jgi:uncharacterized protein YndB with AHSA1/START domain